MIRVTRRLLSLLMITVVLSAQLAGEPPITDADREHWSFVPLNVPAVPDVPSSQLRGPIDAFISHQLATERLPLAPEADSAQLLRRLTFDLTGLPPTVDELKAFEAQSHLPDAYERQLDRLLASPSVGEHLAQSWLDLARYAETDGFEHDLVRPEAWRYRDWVIESINRDLPYDRFMQLQIAGDLVDPESSRVATMFCLAGPDMPDLNDQVERRHNLLNEMTGTVGSVFLGLQLGCAACHDHKTDPLSQADFYRLRGILASGVAKLERDKPWSVMVERDQLETTMFYHRGDHRQPTAQLEPGVPRIASSRDFNQLVKASMHPRVDLADWLASPANPLPARAEANRIWRDHFGVGLCSTPGDLGLMGDQPRLTQLLDYLSAMLREHDWSRQWLRRQILLSATYRQASYLPADQHAAAHWQSRLERDPENRLFSRYPRRRLAGEVVRDTMLHVAGMLNRQRAGESVRPPLPEELRSALLPGQWKTSEQTADHARRSIYIFARRNLRFPIFESFDRPDAGASCPLRAQSVTATQSLMMMNSQFSVQMAQEVAKRVSLVNGEHRAGSLWQMVLGRSPLPTERQLLDRLTREFDDEQLAIVAAALALMNSSEFITVD